MSPGPQDIVIMSVHILQTGGVNAVSLPENRDTRTLSLHEDIVAMSLHVLHVRGTRDIIIMSLSEAACM